MHPLINAPPLKHPCISAHTLQPLGLRSLLFNIVGRRLSNTLRVQLFNGIVIQDVAFFDGNSSGQLTSRLTNDVSFMVAPIQSMIGTLLSNGISLLGKNDIVEPSVQTL